MFCINIRPFHVMAMASSLLVLPTMGEVYYSLSTQQTYRQGPNKKAEKAVAFREGSFNFTVRDGYGTYGSSGCFSEVYLSPDAERKSCPQGTNAFLIDGTIDDTVESYFDMTSVTPATVIEPNRPDLCILRAAPKSNLPRPSSEGFEDQGILVFYNLQSTDVSQYAISSYNMVRTYTAGQKSKFDKENVPGVYHFTFPRLTRPDSPVPLNVTLYSMVEGYAKVRNKKTGVRFTAPRVFDANGFLELSTRQPTIVTWEGLSLLNVFTQIDKLYFSVKELEDPADPLSDASDALVFPNFTVNSRVLLPSPLTTSYTIPPVVAAGTTGVIELELVRDLYPSTVGAGNYGRPYRRTFQVPVIFVDK